MKSKNDDEKKINRLIIVGNGFDLSLGLKSSYKDFLYNYLLNSIINIYKKVEETNNRHINLMNSTYDFNDGLIDLKVPSDRTSFTIKEEYQTLDNFKKLSDYLIKNKILTFEYSLMEEMYNNLQYNNWVDIEVLYYDVLVDLVKSNITNRKVEKIITDYNYKFNLLRIELVKYLKSIKPPWLNDNSSEVQKKVSGYLFNFFEKLFYVKDVENPKPVNKVMFLNFNYTPSIDNLVYRSNLNPPNNFTINYIHGNVTDENSVIFGFGHSGDININTLENVRGVESLRFMKQPYYNGSSSHKKIIDFIEGGEYEVYILGHSCGVSDKTLLNRILDNKYCCNIRVFHHDDYHEKSMELNRYFPNTDTLTDKIKTKTKLNDDIMSQIKL